MQVDGKVQSQKEASTRKNGGVSFGLAGVGLVGWMTLIGKERGYERVLKWCFGVSAGIISGPCHELQKGRRMKEKR
jgi:hypothetical protein